MTTTITDKYSNITYDVLALADVTSSPNPDAEGEFLVEVTSPSGDNVTVSGVSDTEFLRDPDGKITVRPPVAPQFPAEEPTNG